jgi:hypothetical protein
VPSRHACGVGGGAMAPPPPPARPRPRMRRSYAGLCAGLLRSCAGLPICLGVSRHAHLKAIDFVCFICSGTQVCFGDMRRRCAGHAQVVRMSQAIRLAHRQPPDCPESRLPCRRPA